MSKALQHDSEFNQFDSDGDGVVTDEELARSERMIQIENMDKLADQQRIMSWYALGLPVTLIAFLCMPFISDARVQIVIGLATTFCATMGTIVVAFMALTAYVRGKMHE